MLIKLTSWLESRWVAPAYVGWVLIGLAAFFFAAATNTLSGWLYVISGVLLGLLAIAAVLPSRNLAGLTLTRQPIRPVAAGEVLQIRLTLTNTSRQPKGLLQVWDRVDRRLATATNEGKVAIAAIAPGRTHRWYYSLPVQRRGLYQWQQVDLRTAAPLGLFWCQRSQSCDAVATVYPTILPLQRCPLLDSMTEAAGQSWSLTQRAQLASDGLTRSLRPYRWGDSTRLIHWRTSARYGELRVRELERTVADQQVILALNTGDSWRAEAFEQAVIAAASLYLYALRRGLEVALWLPTYSLVQGQTAVLSTLAVVESAVAKAEPPQQPLVWLTNHFTPTLPPGSRQLCWATPPTELLANGSAQWIDLVQPLQAQLQIKQ